MSKYKHTKYPSNRDVYSRPKTCHVCGNKNIGFEILDSWEGVVHESIAYCKKCNEYLGHFHVGNWEF